MIEKSENWAFSDHQIAREATFLAPINVSFLVHTLTTRMLPFTSVFASAPGLFESPAFVTNPFPSSSSSSSSSPPSLFPPRSQKHPRTRAWALASPRPPAPASAYAARSLSGCAASSPTTPQPCEGVAECRMGATSGCAYCFVFLSNLWLANQGDATLMVRRDPKLMAAMRKHQCRDRVPACMGARRRDAEEFGARAAAAHLESSPRYVGQSPSHRLRGTYLGARRSRPVNNSNAHSEWRGRCSAVHFSSSLSYSVYTHQNDVDAKY